MTYPTIGLSVHCETPAEAKVAYDAVMAFRQNPDYQPNTQASPSSEAMLAERLEQALNGAPLNKPRALLLEQLLSTEPGAWLAYHDIQATFEKAGLNKEQAQAALRDLSWQMKEFLPAEDLSGLSRSIEVLADRVRSAGVYQYRLTAAGRTAVRTFLASKPKD